MDTVKSTESKAGSVWPFTQVLKQEHWQEGVCKSPGVGLTARFQRGMRPKPSLKTLQSERVVLAGSLPPTPPPWLMMSV